MRLYAFAVTLFPLFVSHALVAQVTVVPATYDLGTVEVASSLNAVFAFSNNTDKNVYLLKVEAPETVAYNKPDRATAPAGTDTLRLVYTPEKNGAFNETVRLYFSDSPEPRTVKFKGNLKILNRVADIDCPTFNGKAAGANVVLCNVNFSVIDTRTKEPVPFAGINMSQAGATRFSLRTQSNGSVPTSVTPGRYGFEVSAVGYDTLRSQYPISRATRQVTFELSTPTPLPTAAPKPVVADVTPVRDTLPAPPRGATEELPVAEYAYNNIVFLIDVSSSMNTADRMPLLKKSMSELAKRLREGDRVAIVTYADKAKVIRESKPVTDKDELQNIIEALTPNGGTSADKGLATAHDVLFDNYLPDGNNQLVLATDGSFSLKESDLQLFNSGTENDRPVNVCVAGFGRNEEALKSLKKTSKRFSGRFVRIDRSEQATDALLDEVKKNSRRNVP